jgi:hypothetical protein
LVTMLLVVGRSPRRKGSIAAQAASPSPGRSNQADAGY